MFAEETEHPALFLVVFLVVIYYDFLHYTPNNKMNNFGANEFLWGKHKIKWRRHGETFKSGTF